MATLLDLKRQGLLEEIEVDLRRREQPFRTLYGTPNFVQWLSLIDTLTLADDAESSAREQVFALLADFISGEPLAYGPSFHEINPVTRGVWELKTPDIRIFGWFPAFDTFVAERADTKANLVRFRSLYEIHRNKVVAVRDALPLDEPKFLTSTEPKYVISF